jgi:ABC-type nitrate/sulfonate/bicarbonate transport system permease component
MTQPGKERAAVVPAQAGTPFFEKEPGPPPSRGRPARAFRPARAGRLARVFLKYLPLLLLALAWEAVVQLGLVSRDLLPSLSDVVKAAWNLAREGDLWKNAAASIYRGGAGLALAILLGGALGIAMAWWRAVDAFVGPLVEALYPLPKSALIPVTVLWLGFGDGSKILLIFLGCMIPVTVGAYNGARSCEQALVWSARSLGASRLRVLWDVVVPSALPELLNGVRTALALTFVLLVSSELIVARAGLGYLIGFLGEGGVYDAMFAVVLVVAFMGFFADRLYLLFVRRVLAWRE